MTSPKLAVVLGAGASHDVCPDPASENDPGWRPPLVSDLFASRAFNTLLNTHHQAANVFNDLRVATRSGEVAFEDELRRRWDSKEQHTRYLMRFVPIALQQFFFEASRAYTFQPVNYSALVARTVGRGVNTAFVTLNYDTILEKVLADYRLRELDSPPGRVERGFSFDSLQSYVSYPHWLLVKLHGSVDWGYSWPVEKDTPVPVNPELHFEPPPLDREGIEVLADPRFLSDAGREPGKRFYPALALPLTGKYGFVCPTAHEQALTAFLADCRFFLFIGFSGKDQDLLDLLAATLTQVERLVIVSKGDVEQVRNRICSCVPAFAAVASFTPTTRTFNDGFTNFVAPGLDQLVDDALASRS